jgi:hypothetical protein
MRLLVAMIGAVLLAILATTPPSPRGTQIPATEFSAARAMSDLREIAKAPHPTGTRENARVRAILVAKLRAMGLQVRETQGTMDAKSAKRLANWTHYTGPTPPLTNIIAVLPGHDPKLPAILLMAHHDTVAGSPGAADDGAGVVSIFETLRALKASGQPLRRDVIALITDGEELGLSGATSFFASDPLRTRVGPIVNMETRGGGGRASMFETGDNNDTAIRLLAGAVRHPVGTSLSVFVYKKLPNSTDLTPAKAAGHFGYNYAFIGRPGLYHSPLATPDNVDQGSIQDMGGQVLDLTRALADTPVEPAAQCDRVFFDVFGLFLVHYPQWFGWVLLGAALLAWGIAARRGGSARDLWRGVAVSLVIVVLAALLTYVLNLASGADGPVNYYDRLAAIPRLQLQALFGCIAAVVCTRVVLALDRPSLAAAFGSALPALLLAAVAQALAPTAAFLVLVPVLIGGVVACLVDRGPIATGTAVVFAAIGIGQQLAVGYFLLQAVGPEMPMVVALPLLLITIMAWPLAPSMTRRAGVFILQFAVLGAVAMALWVRFDAVPPSVATYSKFGAPH